MSQPWPESLYREAVIIMNAEAGYKLTAEEIDEEAQKRRRTMVTSGFVAGRDYVFWSQFIKDGRLDEQGAMTKGGLTEEQLPEKISEMEELGWLEAPGKASEDEIETGPLKIVAGVPIPNGVDVSKEYETKE